MQKFVIFSFFFIFENLASPHISHIYDYFKNGADWPNECAIGTQQSPININPDESIACDPNMIIDIRWNKLNLTSKTQNYAVTFMAYANWSTLYASDYDGKIWGYDAHQFHFHAPSEHTIDGLYFDLEMHIVHSIRSEFLRDNPLRPAAVIGILFNVDDNIGDNPFFVQYDPTSTAPFTINMSALLGSQISQTIQYYMYSGSLTTPPCTEIVNWYILANPLTLSSTQLSKFTNYWANNVTFANGKGNNRKIMPLNERKVKVGGFNNRDFAAFLEFFILLLFIIYVIFKVLRFFSQYYKKRLNENEPLFELTGKNNTQEKYIDKRPLMNTK